jgi:hypothetical protein
MPLRDRADDEVDVVGCTWLAIKRACEATADEVVGADLLKRACHPQRNLDR